MRRNYNEPSVRPRRFGTHETLWGNRCPLGAGPTAPRTEREGGSMGAVLATPTAIVGRMLPWQRPCPFRTGTAEPVWLWRRRLLPRKR